MIKYTIILVLLLAGVIKAQTLEQKLLIGDNDMVNGGRFSFYYQLKGSNLPASNTLAFLNVDMIYDSSAIRFIGGSEWYTQISDSNGYKSFIQSNEGDPGITRALRISIVSPDVNSDGKNTKPGYDIENTYRNLLKINFIILDNTKTVNILIKNETNQIGLFANKGNNPNTFDMTDVKLSSPVMLNDIPLPIQLAEFKAAATGRDVNLVWKTSFEQNNFGFDIERKSRDGDYTKVGFIQGNNKNSSYSFKDKKLNNGKYSYRLKQIDNNGNYEYFSLNAEITIGLPQHFNLSQNYPNPFNPSTKIDFELPSDSRISIQLYDMLGREVKTLVNNENLQAGYHTIELNSSTMSSGTYFYRMNATDASGKNMNLVKKMTVVK
jgi:hypothetical protein